MCVDGSTLYNIYRKSEYKEYQHAGSKTVPKTFFLSCLSIKGKGSITFVRNFVTGNEISSCSAVRLLQIPCVKEISKYPKLVLVYLVKSTNPTKRDARGKEWKTRSISSFK